MNKQKKYLSEPPPVGDRRMRITMAEESSQVPCAADTDFGAAPLATKAIREGPAGEIAGRGGET